MMHSMTQVHKMITMMKRTWPLQMMVGVVSKSSMTETIQWLYKFKKEGTVEQLMHIAELDQLVDMNTMTAPKSRVGQVLTKIMAYLMTTMANKLNVGEKRLIPHTHTVALPISKLHMMKEVETSDPCMLAMMQYQL